MSNRNDSKTKAFSTVNNTNKGFKTEKSRQKFIIAIFVVIILILSAFATLIGGQIVDRLNSSTTTTPKAPDNLTYVPKDAGDVRIGGLLFINDEFQYKFPTDVSNITNIYEFQKNTANREQTHITVNGNSFYTYLPRETRITLDITTLEAFNQMILDYCHSIDFTNATLNETSVSNIDVAWGYYDDINEYEQDISDPDLGKEYYDHALGTVVTLRRNSDKAAITEEILKNEYTWIYENAHKYGFIIRFPDACADHTGYDSTKRVHLRYIGVEHATYIYNNGICLEKYLETLRTNHSFDNPLSFIANGNTYEVYYVAYAGNPTSIPVSKNEPYTISGDNMNGFIVTVTK